MTYIINNLGLNLFFFGPTKRDDSFHFRGVIAGSSADKGKP